MHEIIEIARLSLSIGIFIRGVDLYWKKEYEKSTYHLLIAIWVKI